MVLKTGASVCLRPNPLPETTRAVTLHGEGSFGFPPPSLKPPEGSSRRKHHLLQSSGRLLFEFLTFSEFANLMASLSVPTTAALLAVDASPAGRAHAAAFPLLLARADG